jgi:hypothetical protein
LFSDGNNSPFPFSSKQYPKFLRKREMSLNLPSQGWFFIRGKENDNEGRRDEKI